jgi:MoxR-like ATPase
MVEAFILGLRDPLPLLDGRQVSITPKFVGDRRLVQVAIATLLSDRALMLVGEPGTAKSYLSEHLGAAISGTSQLVIQGTAGTTEDHIKYAWNYALLIAQGPSREALVPSPILRGMETGRVVRFEEVTRCAAVVQDALISLLSDKTLSIPELDSVVLARRGFAVIGTANTRDRGVNDMSAALKRRFNFVTIPVLTDVAQEVALVERRSRELLAAQKLPVVLSRDVIQLMATVFAELRRGATLDDQTRLKTPSTVLSTAELIAVVTGGALQDACFGDGRATAASAVAGLIGTVMKENASDAEVLREYVQVVARTRSGPSWQAFHQAAQDQLG